MMLPFARIVALVVGWLAASATAALAHLLLGTPVLPVLLAGGGVWTCLLLLQ
jgi:hypothetical protein